MLGKLLKYEIKSTARIFLPLYAVLLVFALLNRFLNPFRAMEVTVVFNLQAALKMLSITAYFILVVAVFVMTVVITIQRFYKNLLGDEGYLMFTLPVKTWQHIASKLLTAMIWYILSTAAVFCSIMILVGAKEVFDFLPQFIQMTKDNIGYSGFVIFPVLILLELAAGTMMIYDGIALGHLFNKHRLLASFAMFCVLYAIQQVLLVIIIFSLGNTMFASIIHSSIPTPMQVNRFITLLSIIAALLTAAHFAVINYVLKRKLNLE